MILQIFGFLQNINFFFTPWFCSIIFCIIFFLLYYFFEAGGSGSEELKTCPPLSPAVL